MLCYYLSSVDPREERNEDSILRCSRKANFRSVSGALDFLPIRFLASLAELKFAPLTNNVFTEGALQRQHAHDSHLHTTVLLLAVRLVRRPGGRPCRAG